MYDKTNQREIRISEDPLQRTVLNRVAIQKILMSGFSQY